MSRMSELAAAEEQARIDRMHKRPIITEESIPTAAERSLNNWLHRHGYPDHVCHIDLPKPIAPVRDAEAEQKHRFSLREGR